MGGKHLTKRSRWAGLLAAVLLLLVAVAAQSGEDHPTGVGVALPPSPVPYNVEPADGGHFRLLTYNVAGIPTLVSNVDAATNAPLISPLLNEFDLVLLQEDFVNHDDLVSQVTHRFRTAPLVEDATMFSLGDGLNVLSRFAFAERHVRVAWDECSGLINGSCDCIATKGFMMVRVLLAQGVTLDVYNLHADAGGGEDDRAARSHQVDQLIELVERRSAGHAVIVAGDTNLRAGRHQSDAESLQRLQNALGLTDATRQLDGTWDRVDRVYYRSSGEVALEATRFDVPPEFRDDEGERLSDHRPVAISFDWQHTAR